MAELSDLQEVNSPTAEYLLKTFARRNSGETAKKSKKEQISYARDRSAKSQLPEYRFQYLVASFCQPLSSSLCQGTKNTEVVGGIE